MRQFNRAFFGDLWRLARPYWWSSGERWSARALLAAIVVLNLASVYITYRVTEWYSPFWNALQNHQRGAAFHQLWVFVLLATPFIVVAVYQTYLTQMLRIRWRRWLTAEYLDAWLARGTYYQMQVLGQGTDNPDQRIAEDLDAFTRQTLELVAGVLNSVTTLAAFIAMLWVLSREVVIPLHGTHVVIPGYLVWAAVIYSLFGTVLVAWVGRPLIQLNFDQERLQADFRFSLVRLRENSESIALYRGEERERGHFLSRFGALFSNFWKIMVRTKRLNWWASGYGEAAIIFPVLVSLPAYFAGAIQIGAIMQIASAFGQVQSALSFVVQSYTSLAAWHAVVDRLRFFEQATREVNAIRELHSKVIRRDGPRLQIDHLGVRLPDGRRLVDDLSLELEPGERLLIMGPTGSGKSTLVRTLAGIWPYARGELQMPPPEARLVLPQKPYLPLGTLRDILLYPDGALAAGDPDLAHVLEQVGLDALAARLDDDRPWAQVLSLGEQQRLAFGRLFLQRPAWVFLDEATSALDEPAEALLYRETIRLLPRTGMVSVGHRSSLLDFHERELRLEGDGAWRLETIVRRVQRGGA